MKKSKFLIAILAMIVLFSLVCSNCSVFATSETEVNSEDEPVATSIEGEPRTTEDTETTDGTDTQSGDVTTSGTDGEETAGHTYGETTQEIYEGDKYIATTDEYEMNELVAGNVYIFSNNNVKITGQIAGSLFVFTSGTLELSEESYIASQVFAAAKNINYNGMVAADSYLAAQEITIGENSATYRDLKAAAETINLSGMFGRDLDIYASTINAPEEEEKLTIYGHLNYSALNEIANLDKATIDGEVNYKHIDENTEEDASDAVIDLVFGCVNTVLFDIVLYMLCLLFAPKFIEKAKEYVSVRGILSLPIGLAFTFLVPVVAFLLLMLGVFTGVSILLALIYGVVLMLNAFVAAVSITGVISQKLKWDNKYKKLLILLPVSIVLWILRQIPVVGTWVSAAIFLYGVGIIVLYQFDKIFVKKISDKTV